MAISGPMTLKEIRPDVGPTRMNSMDSYKIKDLEAEVLPNYLRASIGSCHDICKFGRKRDAMMEIRASMPGKLPVSPNRGREPDKSNNMKKNNSFLCTSTSPSTVRNPAYQVKTKEIQPGAKEVVANAKNPQKLRMKPLEKKGALNDGWNYGINASKLNQTPRGNKKSLSVPKTGSLAEKPEVRKVLEKASCSKNKDTITKAEFEPASVEDIPEKILFITELNSESQAVGFNQEENIFDDSRQCQKQIDASLLQKTEDESYVDKEIDSVQFSTGSSSSKESNYFQSLEWDNSNESSSSSAVDAGGSSNLRTQDVHCKQDGNEKENEMNNVFLQHQNVQQKRSTETARERVKTRKGKVKALVHAFETVISLQDLSFKEQLKCGELPKFPLCVD